MKKNQVFFTLLMILAIGAGNMQAATAKWYSNGAEIASQDAEAGTALEVPANPTNTFFGGYAFAGWTTEAIDGKYTVAPAYVNTTGLVMPENDINYYAVFGREEQKTVIANPNDSASLVLYSGQNEAAKLGLNAEQWSVVGSRGGGANDVTLTNDNTQGKLIRMYFDANGSNTLTITAPSTIESVHISFTGEDYSKVWIKVNDEEVAATTNGIYAINAQTFTIGVRNDATKQVRITQIDVIFASASYATTFTKPDPEISWSSYDTEIILLGYSATPEVRSIINPHNLPVRYRSGDSSVMEVNPTTGVITAKAMGYASMFVEFEGNEEYAAGNASYPVRVYGYDHIELSGEATKTAYEHNDESSRAGIKANAVYTLTNQSNQTLDVTELAEWTITPKRVTTDGNISVTATWGEKSAQKDVAVTVKKHKVTIVQPEHGTLVVKYRNDGTPVTSGEELVQGTHLIFEITPESSDYKAGKVVVNNVPIEEMEATIGKIDYVFTAQIIEKAEPVFGWSAAEAYYSKADDQLPEFTNEAGLAISFTSSDESVATVDQEGDVYPRNVTGTTVISAIFAGNDTYKAKTASYTLHVTHNVPAGENDLTPVPSDQVRSTKVLRDNQIFILRGNKTYTIDGQMVK